MSGNIYELDKYSENTSFEYDVCIVGSGVAGMVLAAELVKSGLNIAVLESGGMNKKNKGIEIESEGIKIKSYSRVRAYGGTSTVWAGLSSPFDMIDFQKREFVPFSGWPITYEQMKPYWNEASKKYGFPTLEFFSSENLKEVKAGDDIHPVWNELEEKVFLAKQPAYNFGKNLKHIFNNSNVHLFLDATVRGLEGEPSASVISRARVRSSSGKNFEFKAKVFVLAANGIENARLLLASKSTHPNGLGNELDVVGRYFMNHPKGNAGLIRLYKPIRNLNYFFGCLYNGFAAYAGLRLTEAEQAKRGLLNSYVRFEPVFPWTDNVGVESFVYFLKNSRALFSFAAKLMRGKVVSLKDYSETGDDSELQNKSKTTRDWFKLVWNIVKNAPTVLWYLGARIKMLPAPAVNEIRLRNFMEMEPSPNNRVTLSSRTGVNGEPIAKVFHDTTTLDRKSITELQAVLNSELQKNNIGTVEPVGESDAWPVNQDASHHLGATRMGQDVQTSVVNSDLRLHLVNNVYVAGGSVFSTSGCANPTYTIAALSIRLAKHLRENIFNTTQEIRIQNPNRKQVIIIGAGKRVKADVLPVFRALVDTYEVAAIYSRSAHTIEVGGETYNTAPLSELANNKLRPGDLVYVAVPQPKVLGVLRMLKKLLPGELDVVIDTPVFSAKYVLNFRLLKSFKKVFVAEDSVTMPWIELVKKELGIVSKVELFKSGYRYHGVALAKALIGDSIVKAKQSGFVAEFSFTNGATATMTEPRDYASGYIEVAGSQKMLSTRDAGLSMIVENGVCVAIQVGAQKESLNVSEQALVGPCNSNDTLVTKMLEVKRVGLYRMMKKIAEGEVAWSATDAAEDSLLGDYLRVVKKWDAKSLFNPKKLTNWLSKKES